LLEVVTNWVTDIIFVVLFASFLELLLPSSSMQRFVRVIMGLFIMMAILNPVIDAIHARLGSIQVPALSTNAEQSAIILNHAKDTAQEREHLSSEIYKKELAKQMKIMIMALDGVADAQVVVSANSDDHSNVSSKINKVVVYVTPGIKNTGVKVEKISIGGAAKEKNNMGGDFENKIINLIAELYQIPKEVIDIKIVHT